MNNNKTLEETTRNALDEMPWLLGSQFEPLKQQLIFLAQDYDASRQTSTSAAWGLAYRFALSLKPTEKTEEVIIDPLEAILKREVSL